MENTSLLKKNAIEHEKLVGTKWNGWSEMFSGRLMIEFVDKTNCIYTSKPNKYEMTYTVKKDKIFVSNFLEPFELRGHMLFSGGLPVFEKES